MHRTSVSKSRNTNEDETLTYKTPMEEIKDTMTGDATFMERKTTQ